MPITKCICLKIEMIPLVLLLIAQTTCVDITKTKENTCNLD